MNFVSLSFLVGVFITFLLYYLAPLRFRYLVLLAASLAFYSRGGWIALLIVFGTAVVSYVGAILIERIDPKDRKKRRRMLNVFLVLIMGFLILTKFISFYKINLLSIYIPIGISYYTFSIVGYLADVYWRKDKAEKNFLHYLLFVCFFPKILQGPISRRKKLGPQLVEGHRFDYRNVCFGLQLMLWGYFKKIVIADRLSILIGNVMGDWKVYSGSILLLTLVLATIQLYCDFSGYMDIARGISQVMGIDLESNFDHPFFSKNVAEFWRRWHITLGTWFKDYVYMPLVISPNLMKIVRFTRKHFGAAAGKNVMTIIPLAIVWTLTGLWHGTGMSYLAWGIYWGTIIILSNVLAPQIKKTTTALKINVESPAWKFFQMVRTFSLFVFGRLLTVPNNISVSWKILKKILFSFCGWNLIDDTIYQLGLDIKDLHILVISIGILWCVSLAERNGSVREKIAEYNFVFRWMFYIAALVTVMVIGIYGPGYNASAFVYMNY